MTETTKVCYKCDQPKPRSEFHVSNAAPDGLMGLCKECARSKELLETERHRQRNSEADPARFETMFKKCAGCQEIKLGTEFYKDNSSASGLYSLCKVCGKEKTREWRAENFDKHQDQRLRRSHNITMEQWLELLDRQGGTCAIAGCPKTDCGISPKTGLMRYLHTDHDHSCCPGSGSCGQCIRGLLCGEHNRVVGFLERSDIVAVKQYLNQFALEEEG